MANWIDLYDEVHTDWVHEKERAQRAIIWLRLHRWVFGPALSLLGIAIGHFV